MEKESFKIVEQALGIYPPWRIESLDFNERDCRVDISLTTVQKSLRLAFFSRPGSKNSLPNIQGQWEHIKLGKYRSVIHAKIPSAETQPTHGIDEHIASLPGFLGNHQRKYSNQVRQEIAQCLLKGLDEPKLAAAYDMSQDKIKQIVKDLDSLPPQMEALSYLPTEMAPVWGKLLTDQILLKTGSLPLKMLLSKLKLASSRSENRGFSWEQINELRQFFIINANNLTFEVQQLCGITKPKALSPQRASGRAKLVLPSIKSHIWLQILGGRLRLNSQSIALNLLISSQRSSFINGRSNQEKLTAISIVREYFLKNYRQLRPELLLINRALAIHKKSSLKLPGEEHGVWRRILHDEGFMSSNYMAYQLLMSKLRAQVKLSQDPVVEIEAARSLRNFINLNQRSMKNELNQIFKTGTAN